MRAVQFLRDIRTRDFGFPGCCDGTSAPITKVPVDLNISIPLYWSDSDMIGKNCF